MSDDLVPGRRQGLSRRQREDRGFRLVVVGGAAGALAAVGAVLAVVGVISWGLPFVAALVAGGCALLFRRMMRAG